GRAPRPAPRAPPPRTVAPAACAASPAPTRRAPAPPAPPAGHADGAANRMHPGRIPPSAFTPASPRGRRPRGGPAPTVRALRVPDTTKPARLWITAPACGVRRRSAGGGGAALLLGRAARAAPRFRLRPRRRVGLRGGGAVGPAVP